MKVIIGSQIIIKDAPQELIQWADDHLVYNNPEYHKKIAMGLWIGDTEQNIVLYQMIGTDLVLPYGAGKYITPFLRGAEIINNLTLGEPSSMSGAIDLYDYQKAAVKQMQHGRNGLLISPAGSGKTQMGIALIKVLGQKALWITHTMDLLNQSKQRAERYFKGSFGTITNGRVKIGNDITFATIQTLVNVDLEKYQNEWNVIIVDEAHRVIGSPTRVMMFYKVLSTLRARHKYGLTATFKKRGTKDFSNTTRFIIGPILHEVSKTDVGKVIIKSKKEVVPLTTPESTDYLSTDGTANFVELITYITENNRRNQEIIKKLKENKNEYNLILSHRIEHLKVLQEMVGEGEFLIAEVKKKRREEIIQEAREGKIRYLFSTFQLAKEGLDIPILNRLHLTTPIKDYISTTQSVGRIERNLPDKKQPIVYDYVDIQIPHLAAFYKIRQRHYK